MSVLSRNKTNRNRHVADIPSTWKVRPTNGFTPSPYFRWKGVIGRTLTAVLLIPGLPVIGLLVLVVRLTSRGPGIHRQSRVGKDGRTFTMYKIRTMRQNAEASIGAVWALPDDKRVTPVGRVLRKLHLDELPQLFNVLKGDMFLIGPRPERPEFVDVLAKKIPEYPNRLAVRPGITGLAQINLPPDTGLESVRHKVALDLEYITHARAHLDVRVLLFTGLRMLRVPGRRGVRRIMGLKREVTSPETCVASPTFLSDSLATPASILVQAVEPQADGDGEVATDGDTVRASNRETMVKPKPK